MPIITLKGEITPDGQLRLKEMPKLPPGPVSVTIRTLHGAGQGGGAGRDVSAGRKVDEYTSGMASYENLPDRDDR